MAAIETWRNPILNRRAWWRLAEALAAVPDGQRRALLRRRALAPDLDGLPNMHDAFADADRLLGRDGASWLDERLSTLPDDMAHLVASDPVDLLPAVLSLRTSAIATCGDLAMAMRDAQATGDADRTANFSRWLAIMRDGRAHRSLSHGFAVMERLRDALALRWPDAPALEPLGSMRRYEPVIGDLDFLVESREPTQTMRRLLAALGIAESHLLTPTHALFLDGDRQVSLRVAGPDTAPALRLALTGSAAHLAHLDARAHEFGLALRTGGLMHLESDEILEVEHERDIYALLHLPWVEPERRHGEASDFADDTTADPLVEIGDIRGDLHTHTIWSDGRDAVDAIVYAARSLKYAYVAITDHSERASAPRTLRRDRIARQADDVARVRQLVPEVEILHGVEVDIMGDGSLDFPDELLARFDIVLASLHERHGHAPAQLLARYEAAMYHPLVRIVTHPANRVPGHDPGYDLDFEAFFTTARETGTVVEVDGGPHHLDLDGHLARRAVAMGVLLSIDSDCHNASRLGRQMRMGVGTARRGGVRPRQVVNTLGIGELRRWLAVKRPRYER